MPKFVLFYYHDDRPAPLHDEWKAQFGRWRAWVTGLGGAMLDPGTALGRTTSVTPNGAIAPSTANWLTGYSIVEAADLDAALGYAKNCPFLEIGTIDVAPAISMQV